MLYIFRGKTFPPAALYIVVHSTLLYIDRSRWIERAVEGGEEKRGREAVTCYRHEWAYTLSSCFTAV